MGRVALLGDSVGSFDFVAHVLDGSDKGADGGWWDAQAL